MEDFYSSILGIPVAGATLPVLAFLSLAVYGKNIILGAAVHRQAWKEAYVGLVNRDL